MSTTELRYTLVVPAHPKVSRSEIIAATLALLERKGRDGFSMSEVAAAVGVRAPSLYGHFADRATLLDEVELALLDDLAGILATQVVPNHPADTIRAQARAYRRFAKKHPNGYALLFDVRSKQTERGLQARRAALAPTMAALTVLVGESAALLAARALAPYMHGFVSMENASAFRLGPGLDAAFEHGIDTVLRGLLSEVKERGQSGDRGDT
jgi:AcrR family transcriptional regulator